MLNCNKKICIIGAGSFGREVLCCIIDCIQMNNQKIEDIACFVERDDFINESKIMGVDVIPQSKFNPLLYDVVVAIADPLVRKQIIEKLPPETTFATIIHPSVIYSQWVEIGEGSIFTAGTILTCNIKIGKHSQLNLHTTVGHDCEIGDYFTTAPGVNISGNIKIGDCVYFGTNAAVKQGLKICDNVLIGMGGIVLNDIVESGVYVGNPIKKLEKK